MEGNQHESEETHRGPRVLVGLGVLFVLVIVGEWTAFEILRPDKDYTRDYVLTLLFNGIPALGISYTGYWLRRSDIEADQYRRVVAWCLGGMAAFLSLNLVIIALWPADHFIENLGWARGSAVYAACGGLIMGVIEARAIKRARVAEREIARTKRVEAKRQWLGYMNSLLRHEVLNTANVIEGYSELLLEEDTNDLSADRLEVIRQQSRNLSEVINDVQVLIEATEEGHELEPVSLSDVLNESVVELRAMDETVDVEAAIPEDVFVRADRLLPRVFCNLLQNAVKHNDSAVPRVSITLATDADTAVVTITDNGRGIPEEKRETLFEGDTRTSNHGLGLYLVRTLTERYGGAIELRETGPEGSVFTVELPRVQRPSAGRSQEKEATGPATRTVEIVQEMYERS
ncbi:sensor histidine kinase [Halogeometricum borinquense]|uniref:sensor histidine kinase n=1 Tax=Halogeometricum borinquense TaxID=60847 RepID=UPI001F4C8E02|nr:HAMP domain-containing sensor histidine kinase [Halogeometricum borinquense]